MTLDGTEWRVHVLAAEDTGAVEITIRFDAGHAGGRGGVNRYRGTYMLDGDELTFGPLMSTRMAGPEEAMRLEALWFQALAQAVTARLDGDELVLRHADGSTSRLRPA